MTAPISMKQFSIAELEKLSQIKAHTIRTWEKRYQLLSPSRKDNNFRLYTVQDLAFLLDVSLLNRCGFRISELGNDKISIPARIDQLTDPQLVKEKLIHKLIVNTFAADIEAFEINLDVAVTTWGADVTIREIILPLLERLELFSYEGYASYEYHFVVTALRRKLIIGIEEVRPATLLQQTVLLFLPEGEHFDLLLLYLSFALKTQGLNVLYLGTNISVNNLDAAIRSRRPDCILTYMRHQHRASSKALLAYLKQLPAPIPCFVSSAMPVAADLPASHLHFVHYRDAAAQIATVLSS